MKQHFIGLFHYKCGTSWRRDIGFFERTPDMEFSLERKKVGNKVKQLPTIHHKEARPSAVSGWWSFCAQSSFSLSGFHLHEPPAEPGGKPWVGTLEEQVPFLPLYHYSITVAGHISNGICRAKVPHLFDGIRPTIAPCDLPGLHITGCIKIRSRFHIDLFRFCGGSSDSFLTASLHKQQPFILL